VVGGGRPFGWQRKADGTGKIDGVEAREVCNAVKRWCAAGRP
jgi:hypothetical protein